MTQVKGFALRGLLKSLKEHGWSISDVMTQLPGDSRPFFDKPIVSSSWYPYPAFVSLVRTIDEMHGGGRLELCRTLGREAAVRDLGTTFRIMSAITSVEFVVKRAHLFWSKYCDTGALVLDRYQDGLFLGRMESFPHLDRSHCLLIEGWLEGIGVSLGALGMRTRQPRCLHQGGPFCEFEGTWTGLKGRFG